jgi:hypothetical protein
MRPLHGGLNMSFLMALAETKAHSHASSCIPATMAGTVLLFPRTILLFCSLQVPQHTNNKSNLMPRLRGGVVASMTRRHAPVISSSSYQTSSARDWQRGQAAIEAQICLEMGQSKKRCPAVSKFLMQSWQKYSFGHCRCCTRSAHQSLLCSSSQANCLYFGGAHGFQIMAGAMNCVCPSKFI